ncbi:MAG: carbohydrate ABC transporter permease [Clostridia bacterium]|nr:carbohydrate ABC transporter permease [Clostridia bacterium]
MEKAKTVKTPIGDILLKVANYTILFFLAFVMLFPFWDIFVKSFMSDPDIIKAEGLVFWPTNWHLEAYKTIFENETYNFGRAFLNSVFITVTDTVYQLSITALSAYALTKKTLPGRKFFLVYFMFTMYFGGGMIPYYIVIRELQLLDKIWVMIIPSFISIFNVLVMKSFFSELPEELLDAARIDGAGDLRTFISIVLPLSKAVLATIALFIAVGVWNNWFTPMLYIQEDPTIRPLAYALQIIIETSRGVNTDNPGVGGQVIIGQSIQYAAIVVAVFPIMAVYPFLQKHFTKGVLIGSIKG